MNSILAKLAADLFAKKGGAELSSDIQRLRDELRKVMEREDTIFGKFRVLLASFREVIPEERQRYHAAIKALSTTSKLSRQEIIKAFNDQLEELKILEKSLVSDAPGWRGELAAMEVRAKGMRGEATKLREALARLESDEQELLKDMAARQKDGEAVEQAARELFADIGAEIVQIRSKVEELTAEPAAGQPAMPQEPVKAPVPEGNNAAAEAKIEIQVPSAQPSSEFQKKCPMCGGLMNFQAIEKMWMCYSCAHEEEGSEDDLSRSTASGAKTSTLAPASPTGELTEPPDEEKEEPRRGPAPISNEPTDKKPCPACKKTMYFFPREKAWRCPSCYYERRI